MTELDSDGDELFSMEDLEKDLKKGRGARRTPWFVAGLVLGIAGTVAVPRLLAPYLPSVFGGGGEILSGPVLAEERDGDRLLLTILAEPGAFIASFTERVAEIGMLVEPGDTVTIAADDYDPFIENPDFEGVRKGSGPPDRQMRQEEDGGPASDGDDVPATSGDVAEAGEGAREGAAADTASAAEADTAAGMPPDTTGGDS